MRSLTVQREDFPIDFAGCVTKRQPSAVTSSRQGSKNMQRRHLTVGFVLRCIFEVDDSRRGVDPNLRPLHSTNEESYMFILFPSDVQLPAWQKDNPGRDRVRSYHVRSSTTKDLDNRLFGFSNRDRCTQHWERPLAHGTQGERKLAESPRSRHTTCTWPADGHAQRRCRNQFPLHSNTSQIERGAESGQRPTFDLHAHVGVNRRGDSLLLFLSPLAQHLQGELSATHEGDPCAQRDPAVLHETA